MSTRSHHLKRIRALTFVREKALDGLTNKEIAKKYDISTRTVARTLTWAEKANIFVELEDQLIAELAPRAMEALKDSLEQREDIELASRNALEVLKGVNIIKKSHAITAKEVREQDDLASYISAKREHALLEQNTLVGDLIEPNEPRLLTEYAERSERVGVGDPPSGPERDSSDPRVAFERPDDIRTGVTADATETGEDFSQTSLPGVAEPAVDSEPQT